MSASPGELVQQDSQRDLDTFREQWLAEARQKAGAPRTDISKLPQDVICEIFQTVAALEPAPGTLLRCDIGRSTARGKGLAWMRLTHVCWSWRATLIGMSDLWGRVAFTFPSPNAFATLVARTRQADVDVISKLNTREKERVKKERVCLPRARSLLIASRANRRLVVYLSFQPMPRLRYLVLHLDLSDYASTSGSQGAQRFTEEILVDATGLEIASFEFGRTRTALALEQAVIPSPGPSMRFAPTKLRSLAVRIDDYAIPHDQPLEWIIALSSASPSLEVVLLSLSCQATVLDWEVLPKDGPMNLPHLKRFVVEDSSGAHHPDILNHLCASPPAFLFASHGTFRGITVTGVSPETLLGRTVEFARSYGGYLCHSGHQALRIQMSGNTNIVTIESMQTLDDPFAFVPREKLSKLTDPLSTFTELTDGVILNVATRHTSLPNRYEWLGTLADRISNKDHIEQLYLQLHFKRDFEGWAELCRDRFLRPMTALHTLYLVTEGPFHAYTEPYWQGVLRLLCGAAELVLPLLDTLLVRTEIPDVYSDKELAILLDKWFDGLALSLSRRRMIGVPVRPLRIVGWWGSSEARDHAKARTGRQLARLAEFVDGVVDERRVLCPEVTRSSSFKSI